MFCGVLLGALVLFGLLEMVLVSACVCRGERDGRGVWGVCRGVWCESRDRLWHVARISATRGGMLAWGGSSTSTGVLGVLVLLLVLLLLLPLLVLLPLLLVLVFELLPTLLVMLVLLGALVMLVLLVLVVVLVWGRGSSAALGAGLEAG